jgi:hypothetical protein
MITLTKEQTTASDSLMKSWEETYIANNKVAPSMQTKTFVRAQIERSMLPTSALIKRMIDIGTLGMAARKPALNEFDQLGEELDRRIPNPPIDYAQIEAKIKKL